MLDDTWEACKALCNVKFTVRSILRLAEPGLKFANALRQRGGPWLFCFSGCGFSVMMSYFLGVGWGQRRGDGAS